MAGTRSSSAPPGPSSPRRAAGPCTATASRFAGRTAPAARSATSARPAAAVAATRASTPPRAVVLADRRPRRHGRAPPLPSQPRRQLRRHLRAQGGAHLPLLAPDPSGRGGEGRAGLHGPSRRFRGPDRQRRLDAVPPALRDPRSRRRFRPRAVPALVVPVSRRAPPGCAGTPSFRRPMPSEEKMVSAVQEAPASAGGGRGDRGRAVQPRGHSGDVRRRLRRGYRRRHRRQRGIGAGHGRGHRRRRGGRGFGYGSARVHVGRRDGERRLRLRRPLPEQATDRAFVFEVDRSDLEAKVHQRADVRVLVSSTAAMAPRSASRATGCRSPTART